MEEKFDPMTGKPLKETDGVKFDPMTGEPLKGADEVKYDPMTGKLLKATGFDPMTGKPIYGEQKTGIDTAIDQMSSKGSGIVKKMTAGGSGNKIPKIVGAVVVIILLIFAGFKTGFLLGKADKVLLACTNTIKDESKLVEALDVTDLIASGKYTVNVNGSIPSSDIDVTYCSDNSKKQLAGSVQVEQMPKVEFTTLLTSKELQLEAPLLGDRVFTYNYKSEKNGYITEALSEDEIDAIDEALEMIYSNKEQKQMAKDMIKALSKEYHQLKFKNAPAKKYEVNDKKRKCKGYKTTITEDNITDALDELEDIVDKYYGESLEEVGTSASKVFESCRYDVEGMPDMDVTFYIYKNKLAAIKLEGSGDTVEIELQGGAYRTENICVTSNDETVMEINGKTDGSVEKSTFISDGYEVGSLKYDSKLGKLTIESSEEGYSVDLNVKSDGKGVTISADSLDSLGIDGEVSIKKGAKFEKLSGEELNIGEATEEQLEEFAQETAGSLYEISDLIGYLM